MASVQYSLGSFQPLPTPMKKTARSKNTLSGRMSRGRKRERPVNTYLEFKREDGKSAEMKRVRSGVRSPVRTRSSKRNRSYQGDRTKITKEFLERATRLKRVLRAGRGF